MIKKINKWINDPFILVWLWMVFLLSPILGSFRILVISNFGQYGFLRGLLSLAYRLIPYASIFLIAIVFYSVNERMKLDSLKSQYKKILKFLIISSILSLIITQLLFVVDSRGYSNFLYSNFGFTVNDIQRINFFSQIMLALSAALYQLNFRVFKSKFRLNIKNRPVRFYAITRLIVVFGFLILLEQSFLSILNISKFKKNVSEDYGAKFGSQYKYISLLKEELALELTVITPPQNLKWPSIGNQPVLRYFLFPRRLVSGSLINNQTFADDIGTAYFVEIDPENEVTHWPKINIEKKTVVFDEKKGILFSSLNVYRELNTMKIYQIIF